MIIRDAIEQDIPACLGLDANYETERVWQTTFQPSTGDQSITFRVERLPRQMRVDYEADEARLKRALSKAHCFLVAEEADEIIGYLTMRYDPTHSIGMVQDVVVTRPYRRHRIGARLLKVARRWATENQLTEMMAETQTKNYPAIQFLQTNGFVFCGFNDHYFRNGDIAVFFCASLR